MPLVRAARGFSWHLLGFWLAAAVICAAYVWLGWRSLGLPWLPLFLTGGMAGVAGVPRILQACARAEAARGVWADIAAASRGFGLLVVELVRARPHDEASDADLVRATHRDLLLRHVAWVTALRHQLRERRPWEHHHPRDDAERVRLGVVEYEEVLGDVLEPLLRLRETAVVLQSRQRAARILGLQGRALSEARMLGLVDDARHLELLRRVQDLHALQGRCEHLKDAPPQRALANFWGLASWGFVGLLPFSLLHPLDVLGAGMVWLTVPLAGTASWAVHALVRSVDQLEHPFQGLADDTPITSVSRAIEIDVRQLLGEVPPPPMPATLGVLS